MKLQMFTVMKKVLMQTLLFMFVGTISNIIYGWNPPSHNGGVAGGGNSSSGGIMSTKASSCTPPVERRFMDFNDLRVLIETGGIMWQDRLLNRGSYFAPKPPSTASNGPSVLYAGALWMGGTDVNGQLKLAGMLFGSRGRDYWTGPLTVNLNTGNYNPIEPVIGGSNVVRPFGEATITAQTCVQYDKFFTVSKALVREFIRWWECNEDPTISGCDNSVTVSAQTLNVILNWPAHGDESLGQDRYLAPFYDRNKNGVYDPIEGGDYPWYDFEDEIDCRNDRRVTLFGDETHWWVFNDKGNIHAETGGDPIGMEVRAQAFSFATNDEVNQMTFYNYEMINRGTQTLFNTFFAQFADPDIGGSEDDYVGCDVSRGLGYAMNGDDYDQTLGAAIGYLDRPASVGIDFFEGPYQDDDGKDNIGPVYNDDGVLITPTVAAALADKGIVYSGLGIGYGDGVIDNERYGMIRFVYFNRAGTGGAVAGVNDDPVNAVDFYRYMRGYFKNNERMGYGGFGHSLAPGIVPGVESNYMFPGTSDPLGWGTPGSPPQAPWSEFTINNPPGDRRFVQAAGPFTLRPGSINNITVGVVFARGRDWLNSRDEMLRADTKAQALFDNCFQILEPPMAPRLRINELENQLILMIDNPGGNNMNEDYKVEDRVNIIDPIGGPAYDKFYRFEGYQIFQIKDETVSVAQLGDSDFARLVAQCDIKNGIGRLINYEFDQELGVSVPRLMVDGEDKGLRHTFSVTEDFFATGQNRRLVNHKTYYYVAISYAHNEYKPFSVSADGWDGQKMPYISSRMAWDGQAIKSVAGIPHNPMPGMDGTFYFTDYGTMPEITRLDGRGNMGLNTNLHPDVIKDILKNNSIQTPRYALNQGPIDIKVIDPLNVKPGHYELLFVNYGSTATAVDTASWILNRYDKKGGQLLGSISSDRTIGRIVNNASIPNGNEQLIPEWGISINVEQYLYSFCTGCLPIAQNAITEPIEATIQFADSSRVWLVGVPDSDGPDPTNWILSGQTVNVEDACYSDKPKDREQRFEKLLNGTFTHFSLIRTCGPAAPIAANNNLNITQAQDRARIASASGVDIVITSDKSKWTRSVVVELCQESALAQGQAAPAKPRARASVDKNGLSAGQPGYNAEEGDLVSSTGMGWFPGYAIDIETGRRLNIAFGENSFLGGQNGTDMLWNPTSRFFDNVGNPVFGGQHVIYIIGEDINGSGMPIYDHCAAFYNAISSTNNTANRDAWQSVMWVGYPMLAPNRQLLETDVTIRIRVSKRFENAVLSNYNGGRPAFEWNMDAIATQVGQPKALAEALQMINVVPNPYYAYSQYERDRIDNRIKIVNLPYKCQVSIYNMQGKLIRAFDKDSPITSIDWDLKNHKGIPITGGVYLIHVRVPGAGDNGADGERVLKWFGGMRQPDFQNL
jgi:hypothetical protein